MMWPAALRCVRARLVFCPFAWSASGSKKRGLTVQVHLSRSVLVHAAVDTGVCSMWFCKGSKNWNCGVSLGTPEHQPHVPVWKQSSGAGRIASRWELLSCAVSGKCVHGYVPTFPTWDARTLSEHTCGTWATGPARVLCIFWGFTTLCDHGEMRKIQLSVLAETTKR